MKIHKQSGGIVFVPTKEELEVRELKNTLKNEIDEVKQLKQELLNIKKEMEG